MIALEGATPNLLVNVQQSNDLENWETAFAAIGAVSSPGYALASPGTVTAAYVRLQYLVATSSGASTVVKSAGVYLSSQ